MLIYYLINPVCIKTCKLMTPYENIVTELYNLFAMRLSRSYL